MNSTNTSATVRADEMRIRFPGGKRVEAIHGDQHILTDQPASSGGDGSAPSPFDLFLASLGSCAGYYVLSFCQERDISTEEIALTQRWTRDPQTRQIASIELELHLPDSFPAKYEKAVIRAAEACAVKRTLDAAPAIELRIRR